MALISSCNRDHECLNKTDTLQKKRAEDGNTDKNRNTRAGLNGGTFFALRSAVIVTFNHEEILLSGKVHVVQAGDFAADSRGRSVLESGDDGLSLQPVCCPHVSRGHGPLP